MRIAVLGAGAWGTALAIVLARSHDVELWARDRRQFDAMRRTGENRRYLAGFPFPEGLALAPELESCAARSQLNLVATPLAGLRGALESLAKAAPHTPVLWVCKGLEAGTGLLPHQVVASVLGPEATCGVLSGPSFAEEVARGLPTAVTLASADPVFARELSLALHTPRLRIYANGDVIGAEVGGAVKNVMAIAAGVADGLGLGHNARAALITRGLAEIARLGEALGGRRETFMGLAGMGDLILTCTGDLSRNRRVGLGLAAGEPLARILESLGHTAEGVSSAREVASLAARLGIDMPITRAVHGLLHEGLPPALAVEALLARDPRSEAE